MEGLRYWLALLRLPGVGPATAAMLLAHFGSPESIFSTGPADPACGGPLREALRNPPWDEVEADLAWLAGSGRTILTLDDPRYPPLLREIPDPPPLLFVQGDPSVLAAVQLAMVGSRNPSRSGAETAHDFARHLGGVGLVITSGLALGIDAASHRGALRGGGQTVAVLGTGPDRVYPASHRELAHAVVDEGGALVSEYPPGTPPLAHHFPRRNRIISGLSLGTLVVEAAARSGSLITARMAMEQGREVFAIPGSIHNPLARGCHRLIRDGAKLVETAADVLEELAPHLRSALQETPAPQEPTAPELDSEYRCLLECVGHEATPVDLLVERSGLTAEAVSSMLLLLELQGYVTAAAGGYVRAGKRV